MGVDAGGTNPGVNAALDRHTGGRRPWRYRKLCQARPICGTSVQGKIFGEAIRGEHNESAALIREFNVASG